MKIITKYSINDKVYILPLKITGRVQSIFVTNSGITFNTRYFDGLKPCDCYFTEDELSLDEPKQEIGFSPKVV